MAIRRQARDGILILGGGFAGAYVARLLRSGSTVVGLENYMLFTPILPEAASGTLEPRHVVVPLRQMCRHADLLLGRVTGLDEDARTVRVETEVGTFDVEYEQRAAELGSLGRRQMRDV
jgi:NADH:ubiquinone reductase (H+-translocating)